ncbi:MAG: putative manganese-dependent inorganic diphosphatase, partial [Candidatus Mcinerneyibacterium aminivorans]
GMKFDTFKEYIDAKIAEKVVCIVGDRENIQEYVIKKKVKALIITGGKMISKRLKKLAEKNKVSILISPYETAKTSWLAIYSTPVKYMGDKNVAPLKKDAYISRVINSLEESISRCLPVVDDENRIKGVISESDLVSDPNIEIIMVDHNEKSQAIEGIENYKILEIIDHHRLGNLHTDYPIRFINKPVGSTSTLIAQMYREHKIPLSKDIASLLLAGILSDTVILQSTTTTEDDKEVAEYLSGITDLSIEEFGKDITRISSQVLEKPTSEILNMDMKVYDTPNYKYSVSQIEVVSPERVMDKKDEFFKELEKKKNQNGYLVSALMVTDIVNLNSLLLVKGDPEYIMRINYPKKEKNVFILNGIISRKKQLIPYLMELVKKYG